MADSAAGTNGDNSNALVAETIGETEMGEAPAAAVVTVRLIQLTRAFAFASCCFSLVSPRMP